MTQIRKALIVGVNRYPFFKNAQGIPCHLEAPEKDAMDIAELLRQDGGFTAINSLPTSLFITKGEPTEEILPDSVRTVELEYAIKALFNPEDECRFPNVALFYFSGHGWRDPQTGECFLLASDANPKEKRNLLSMRWLREQLDKSPIEQQIILLDCCHSGGFLAEEDSNSSLSDRCLITACRPSQAALGDLQNGFLTRKLLELLKLDDDRPFVTSRHLEAWLDSIAFPNGQEPLCQNWGERTIVLTDKAFKEPKPTGECPYLSLNYFDVKDSHFFFGRTELTDELIGRVQQQQNLIVVTGASGSGKSSLLRAGLLCELEKGQKIAGSENWFYFPPFTPGDLLLRTKPEQFKEYLEQITEQEKQKLKSFKRKVMIIDQFEECFTKTFDKKSRETFLNWIGRILDENAELSIIIGMRNDFRSALNKYPEFTNRIVKFVNVKYLSGEEFKRVIVEPAKKVGLYFDEELKVKLINDVEDYPESLPLLQFTLTELWKKTQKPPYINRLILDDYIRIGGIEGTLNKRADEVYNSLNKNEKIIARRIFLELIQIGENKDTRRKVRLQDLVNSHPNFREISELDEVAQKLAKAHLISYDEDERNPDSTIINLTHEALLSHWEQFKKWKDDFQIEISMLIERRLEYQADAWRKNGKKNKDLLTYGQVIDAVKYRNDPRYLGFLDRSAEEFIDRSQVYRSRQRGGQITIGAVFVLAILTLAALAKSQEWVANIRRDIAMTNSQLTDDPVQRLVSAIKFTSATQKNWWNLLFTGAADQKNWRGFLNIADIRSLAIDEVQPTLQNAVGDLQEYNRLKGHELSINDVDMSEDGATIVSAGVDKTVRIWKSDKSYVLPGHTDSVVDVAVSHDPQGKVIVSGSLDHTAKVWDTESGRLLHTLPHGDSVTDVVISQDGKTIASSSTDRNIYIWDTASGKRLHVLSQHKGSITDIVISQDGKTIASASLDRKVGVWDTATGKLRHSLLNNQSPVTSIAISPDGRRIVSGGQDNKVRIWDAREGKLLYTLTGHQGTITSVKIDPDNGMIACAGEDAVIRLWDLNTGKLRYTLLGHQASINMMMFAKSQDKKKLILFSAGKDKTIRLWDTATGRLLDVLVGHTNPIEAIDYHFQTNTLVSASGDRTIRIWHPNLRTPQYLPTDRFSEIPVSSSVNVVATTKNSSILAVGDSGNVVQFWDLRHNRQIPFKMLREKHTGAIYTLAFSPDGNTLASADADRKIFLWDIPSRTFKRSLNNPKGNPISTYTLAFNPTDPNQLASGGRDRKIWLWDIRTGKPFLLGEHSRGSINAIAFSPDGQILASADRWGTIRIWNARSQRLIRTLKNQEVSINALAFHPKRQHILVSASTDWKMLLWNIDTGEFQEIPINEADRHTGSIQTIAFSSDGQHLASAGNDTTIRLWKEQEGVYQFERILGKHQAPIHSIAFSSDDKILISGGDDATVHYWLIDKPLPDLKPACEHLRHHPVIEDVREICQAIDTQK